MISSDTDIKIFIEHHRSANNFLTKERFTGYNDSQAQTTPNRRISTATSRKALLATPEKSNNVPKFDIEQNYLAKQNTAS